MAASLLDRALSTLEMMSTRMGGVSVTVVADEIGLPKSGAHRLLADLIRLGYVRQ
ncbi:helix-turn-helix domain-containing protein, partial [Bosea caraganae]|uniref:helix-turn-helix domain-containing protein n=1 Tax=Bosea caraganae TaxID=2763117 RepID=UPI0011C035F8